MRNLLRACAAAMLAALVIVSAASAHARISPAVSLANELQLYSLAVPTEKEGATTTKIVADRARGLLDRLVRAEPRLAARRAVDRLRRGRGDPEGDLDGRQRADRGGLALPVPRAAVRRQAPTRSRSQQTYSDGSIVNWAGSESSEDPAPTIEAKSSLGGGGTSTLDDRRARRRRASASSLGAIALLARRAESASWHEATGGGSPGPGGEPCRARAAAAALAHAYLVRTVPEASVVLNTPPAQVALTFDEAVEPRFAIISVTEHARAAGDDRPGTALAGESRHAGRPAPPAPARRAGTSSTGGRSRWTATRCRARSRSRSGRTPGRRRSSSSRTSGRRRPPRRCSSPAGPMFLTVMTAIGLFVLRHRDRAAGRPPGAGTSLRRVSLAFVVASVLGLVAMPVYLEESTAVDSLRSAFDVRRARAALADDRVRARLRRHGALLRALLRVAAWIALWVDRPEREHRSVAELLSTGGALRPPRPSCSCPAARVTRRRRRRAASPSCSTGSTSSPARSGSAG